MPIRTTWHPERLETVRTMAREGSSATEIGELLQCSRNAVIGAAHRNRIHLRVASGTPRPPKIRQRKPAVHAPRPLPIEKPEPPPAPSQPCDLLELTNYSCRWILSPDGPPYLFCGALDADLDGGRPYCRAHSRMAYVPRRA